MSSTTFKVGDLVIIDPDIAKPRDRGVVFRVTKVLAVNIVAQRIDGGTAVRGKPESFRPAPTDTDGATMTTEEYLPPLDPGQVVTVTQPHRLKEPPDQLYVVLDTKSDGRVKIARLGGDSGRYWPSVPRAILTVVDRDRITLTPTT